MDVALQDGDLRAHLPHPGQHAPQVVTEAAEAPQAPGQALPVPQQPLKLPAQAGDLGTLPRCLCPLLVCPPQRPLPPRR